MKRIEIKSMTLPLKNVTLNYMREYSYGGDFEVD